MVSAPVRISGSRFLPSLKKDRPNGKDDHPGRLGTSGRFASPAGQPSHVSYATAHEAQQYAEQRAADLHRTVMDFLMASGFITPLPRA